MQHFRSLLLLALATLILTSARVALAEDVGAVLPVETVKEMLLGKTVKLLDIDRNSRGYNQTVTATFNQEGAIDAWSTSGAKNVGTLSFTSDGRALMQWKSSIWPEWAFTVHKNGNDLIFRLPSKGVDKFLLRGAQ